MKKYYLFLALLAGAASCNTTATYVNDLTDAGLKGNISAITENIYTIEEVEGELREKEFVMSTQFEYNEGGNLTRESAYDRNGKLATEETRAYDENNLLIERAERTKRGFLFTTKLIERGKHYTLWAKSDGEYLVIRYKGKEEKELLNDKRLLHETTYDKNHKSVSEKMYNQKYGTLAREISNQYEGYLLKTQTVKTNGEVFISTYEYKSFDENGNWTKAYVTDGEENGETFIYTREITYR